MGRGGLKPLTLSASLMIINLRKFNSFGKDMNIRQRVMAKKLLACFFALTQLYCYSTCVIFIKVLKTVDCSQGGVKKNGFRL